MNTLASKPSAIELHIDEETMRLELADGRQLGVPLWYFPRLLSTTPKRRQKYIISGGGTGLHWDELDEDILVENLLMGLGDVQARMAMN